MDLLSKIGIMVLALQAWALPAAAGIQYSGRIVGPTGKPVNGPINLEVAFFDAADGGTQLGATLSFTGVVLKHGVFQVDIDVPPADAPVVYGGATTPWLQVRDVTHNKTYSRQQVHAVPYALRVPVDGASLGYNASGQLQVTNLDSVQSSTLNLESGGNTVTLQAPGGLGAPVVLTLPPNDGGNDQVLTTDGNGLLTWTGKLGGGGMAVATYDNAPADGAIDVSAGGTGTDLSLTGGANQFVKQSGVGSAFSVGTIALGDLPAGTGTVTSVGVTAPAAGITVSGGPVTTSGNMTIGLADDLAALENLATAGIVRRTGPSAWSTVADDSTNWGTGYTERRQWDGGATNLDASAARTNLGLGNVQNTNVLNNFTQNDGQRISTDEIRARDAGGLALYDDSGAGVFVEDGGSVGIGTTNPGNGLSLDTKLQIFGNGTGVAGRTALVVQNASSDSASHVAAYNSAGQSVSIQAGGPTYGGGQIGSLQTSGGMPLALTTDGDLATGGSSPMAFATGGYSAANERMRITSGGNVGIGTTTPSHLLTVFGDTTISRASDDNGGVDLNFHKARGTHALKTVVTSGDAIGASMFRSYDGANYILAATITGGVDGTPGTNDMPGRLVFSTTADGGSSPEERMRIDSAGNVGVGTTNPAAGLDVQSASGIRARQLCDETGANCHDISGGWPRFTKCTYDHAAAVTGWRFRTWVVGDCSHGLAPATAESIGQFSIGNGLASGHGTCDQGGMGVGSGCYVHPSTSATSCRSECMYMWYD